MHPSANFLRLNVGFLIGQTVGYSRDFIFESASLHLEPDLDLEGLIGNAHITRTAQGLLVQVSINATTPGECVRCLSNFHLHLHADFTELYAFSSQSVTDSELILPESGYINLAPLVREYLLLEVPISPICSPDCKGLCPVCGENLNETACEHTVEPADSPFAVYKPIPSPED